MISKSKKEVEYFKLLARFWSLDDDPKAPSKELLEEASKLVVKLDELYQELHRQGRKVPVRLPKHDPI